MVNSRNITYQEFKKGVSIWRPTVIQALSGHSMTANELIFHLLAENYGNIDKESDLITVAINELLEIGRIRACRVVFNNSRKAETYLTSDLTALY